MHACDSIWCVDQAAKLEPFSSFLTSLQLPSHYPRVLTATAKGMEHWSKYKMQIPMLFEIFGVSDLHMWIVWW